MATIVVRLPSLATSLAQAVKYNTKIPDARDIVANESLDTLVDFGNTCFNNRRIHAIGGSNSTFALGLLAVVLLFSLVVVGAPCLEEVIDAISADNLDDAAVTSARCSSVTLYVSDLFVSATTAEEEVVSSAIFVLVELLSDYDFMRVYWMSQMAIERNPFLALAIASYLWLLSYATSSSACSNSVYYCVVVCG